jgi:hypothetical protein
MMECFSEPSECVVNHPVERVVIDEARKAKNIADSDHILSFHFIAFFSFPAWAWGSFYRQAKLGKSFFVPKYNLGTKGNLVCGRTP